MLPARDRSALNRSAPLEVPDASHALTPALDRTRSGPRGAHARAGCPPPTPGSTTAGSRWHPGGRRKRQHLLGAPKRQRPSSSSPRGPATTCARPGRRMGKPIAYCADTSGAFEIWTMHSDGTKQRQLTHLGGFAVFPTSRPTDRRSCSPGSGRLDSHSEIYVVDARNGEGLRALTSCAGLADGCYNDLPVWSPDGSRIVFIHARRLRRRREPRQLQVWVMDADGGHPHALTSDSALKDQVPDWSPDGSKIAYNAGSFGSGGSGRWTRRKAPAPADRVRRR